MLRIALSASLALALLGACVTPSFAIFSSDGGSTMWFWEDAYHYGWSDTPQPTYGQPPPRILKRMSIEESCGRQAGRIVRFETSALVESTQL